MCISSTNHEIFSTSEKYDSQMGDISKSSEGVFAHLLDLVPLDESETQTLGQHLVGKENHSYFTQRMLKYPVMVSHNAHFIDFHLSGHCIRLRDVCMLMLTYCWMRDKENPFDVEKKSVFFLYIIQKCSVCVWHFCF